MAGTAWVLAGHGSHISAETGGLVWRLVDRLRARGAADEITAAFWKETPSFATVLRALTADDVTVIPLFTARGYFTQTVIPAEMGLQGAITPLTGRTIRYTRTLGEHPAIGAIMRGRVTAALAAHDLEPAATAIAVIGHSTRRNPESRRATEAQADTIRAAELAAEVHAVYLDDEPSIPAIYAMTDCANVIAVPYFLTAGSHVMIDVPGELGLTDHAVVGLINGRKVIYTPPIGAARDLDTLIGMIESLAADAGSPARTADGVRSVWGGAPLAGRDTFIEAMAARGDFQFGQLAITPRGVQVTDDPAPDEVLTTPGALRDRVRRVPFRPLATSADLPGGWRVESDEPHELHAAVETIYPGVIADWAAHQAESFVAESFESTIARQTGMYKRLATMDEAARAACVDRVCGACVRHPTWHTGAPPPDAIPCPEPCNVWLSAALDELSSPPTGSELS